MFRQWPGFLEVAGLVMGLASVFLPWAVPSGGDFIEPSSLAFVPSTSLAYFLQLPFVTLPDTLPTFLHPDAWSLAFVGAWLFAAGLLIQLLTRWGLAIQVLAIALFVPVIVTWPLTVGPGLVLGCLSAIMVGVSYFMLPRVKSAEVTRQQQAAAFGVALVVLVVILVPGLVVQPPAPGPLTRDAAIADMLQQVDEHEIFSTVYDLQNFTSRYYGTPGNMEASSYLFDRLSDLPGLSVEYQGGELRNVIATLPGKGISSEVYMVGAHYDSESNDPSFAPGATDNGGGVAIVLELARVMSQHSFDKTIKFALWNTEEGGASIGGSQAYVRNAVANHENIALYLNFDSSCYDPNGRMILDIMYDDRSAWAADMMTEHNDLYGIGFNLTYRVYNTHGSDHRSFWGAGYVAIMTHAEDHGPAQTVEDTVDQVSTRYAQRNGQLGMSVVAKLAGPI